MPRSTFVAHFRGNETNPAWSEQLIAEGQPFSHPLERNLPAIRLEQEKLLGLQRRVVLPLDDFREVCRSLAASEVKTQRAKDELVGADLRVGSSNPRRDTS